MAHFRNKKIDGRIYDLSHLDRFTFPLAVGQDPFTVSVEFSCHCFTEKLDPVRHSPGLHYQHQGELRAFNIERHGLSLMLPNLIETLGNRSVYHSEKGSFFLLRDQNMPQGRVPYVAFFDAFKSRNPGIDVRLIIRSAYLKPGMSRYAAPVKFTTLIKTVAQGGNLTAGPTVHIRRR